MEPELKPCPFCRSEYLTISHDDYACSCKIQCECGCSVEWLSDCMTKEDLEKLVIKKWNSHVYPKETDLYIHHPVTGEQMDKSMCKRVIAQMYDKKRAIKVKRHSTQYATYDHCGSCNAPLSSTYSFCPNCGQRLDWGENES